MDTFCCSAVSDVLLDTSRVICSVVVVDVLAVVFKLLAVVLGRVEVRAAGEGAAVSCWIKLGMDKLLLVVCCCC